MEIELGFQKFCHTLLSISLGLLLHGCDSSSSSSSSSEVAPAEQAPAAPSIPSASIDESTDGEWLPIAGGQPFVVSKTQLTVGNETSSSIQKFISQNGATITFGTPPNADGTIPYGAQTYRFTLISTVFAKMEYSDKEVYLIRSGIDDANVLGEVPGNGLSLLGRTAKVGSITFSNNDNPDKKKVAKIDGSAFKVESVESGTYNVEVSDDAGQRMASLPSMRIDRSGQYIGSIVFNATAYNFKSTFYPENDLNVRGGKYKGLLKIQNVGTEIVKGVNFRISSPDANLTLIGTTQGILNSIPAGESQTIVLEYSIGDLPNEKHELPIDIVLRDVGGNQWNDRVFVVAWRSVFGISFASDRAVISGFVVLQDRVLKSFSTVGENSSNSKSAQIFLPTIQNFKYQLILSAVDLKGETSYSIGIGRNANSSFESFLDTSAFEPNDTEVQSTELEKGFRIQSYLHIGDIDFYSFTLPTTSNAANRCEEQLYNQDQPFGLGTSFSDPIVICDKKHFSWLKANQDRMKYSILVLGRDIDMTGHSSGSLILDDSIFDGDGHTLSNFTISQPSSDYVGLFSRVTNDSVVKNLKLSNFSVTGRNYVGALAGDFDGTISQVAVIGGSVSGISTVGGLIGQGGSVRIDYSSSSAVVAARDGQVGGLVGNVLGKGVFFSSYATGSVSATYLSAVVGGLIGSIESGYVIDCFASGAVERQFGDYCHGTCPGGLIGHARINLYDSFWDRQTTGQSQSSGSQSEYGKTTSQMKSQSTFTGWDFDTIWYMPSGGYPALR